MSFWPLLLIAGGVAADAFAVSLGKGLACTTFKWRAGWKLAGAFGAAQALMLLLGWVLAAKFSPLITGIDHWIAFTLLGVIGLNMLWGALKAGGRQTKDETTGREVLVLAIATSIDALAVGIALAFLAVDIVGAAALVGVTTLAFSLVGFRVGHRANEKLGTSAEIAGGVLLVGIGTNILFSHLGFW
ncbi:manganese efflux pump MntP family protein [Smaragdicoccus niigatensis]|uniref:manganese efflux pump MntP n=1 Tax=Smaragdicoccus niigatensis TaxID=359359 RepID=UPI00037F4A96|nr:manganese efflux pump MntP family protein [Smaragdicoccus niigatensis]